MGPLAQNSYRRFARHKVGVCFLITITAATFIFFFGIGSPTIRMWDESFIAVNAVEMIARGDYVVRYFGGEPDLANTKPPLALWLMVGSAKIFGLHEASLRLPSALAGLLTVILLFVFCLYFLHDLKAGVMSSFVLMTSIGFVGEHVARMAGYDSLLVLSVTMYSLTFFMYIHSIDPRRKRLCLLTTAVALVLAVWTKGVAGLMCLPALLVYVIWQGKLRQLLLSPLFYVGLMIFFALAPAYYILREYAGPGYVHAVVENELWPRYFGSLQGHRGDLLFYVRDVIRVKYIPWIYAVPISAVLIHLGKNKLNAKVGLFSVIFLSCYLLIISFAQTKLPWYDAPLYPMGALLIGVGMSAMIDKICNATSLHQEPGKRVLLTGVLLASLIALPYLETAYHWIYNRRGIIYPWSGTENRELQYGDYLRHVMGKYPAMARLKVVNDDYNSHLMYYAEVACLNGHCVKIVSSEDELQAGDVIITCFPEVLKKLEKHYSLNDVDSTGPCRTLLVRQREDKKK